MIRTKEPTFKHLPFSRRRHIHIPRAHPRTIPKEENGRPQPLTRNKGLAMHDTGKGGAQ